MAFLTAMRHIYANQNHQAVIAYRYAAQNNLYPRLFDTTQPFGVIVKKIIPDRPGPFLRLTAREPIVLIFSGATEPILRTKNTQHAGISRKQAGKTQGQKMDVTQLTELLEEFNYILARVSKYLKNHQYVYLRAFNSWQDSYNSAAERLNTNKTMSVPVIKMGPIDYSPTGKSIKMASVEKFIKTINHQVIRLEDKIEELNKAAEEKMIPAYPLEKFFHHDTAGIPVEPPLAEKRVFVAIPGGAAELKFFWRGIQPALEARGLSFFRADRPLLDDAALCELSQELHSCRLAIFNLADQAPNVMLALGLAWGIGKPVIILQPESDEAFGEINNQGYVRYTGATDLKTTLGTMLPELLDS